MLKIIWTDGYAREYIADRLVCDNIKSVKEGKIMLEALRAAARADESQWYLIVESSYVLNNPHE